MDYIYNDEDNAPMNDDAFDGPHNPTVYLSRAEMEAAERLPFDDPEPDRGCWNCILFDGDHCTKEWNNADPDYYIKWRDDKEPTDCCEDWEEDESAVKEDFFDE